MKRLYLMRHGQSPTTSESGVAKDALRPLSERGRADARRMAAELTRRGAAPKLILHSPLLRAVQTAEELSSVLQPAGGKEAFTALDNTLSAEEVQSALTTRGAEVEEVVAVGHQPQIGEITSLLVQASFEFYPGTIVAVELQPEPRVLWTISPESRS
ncbi:MAG: phosphohistidine phosphatase SixA [Elusimicrobia bacterium CG11_big_fil_rev_8_21_14_0_20_64_6]|nr:MAG: phosphohistidine phosphatase SixA [Elusimicrobia bacterium CG11_big_fil_rev_8_21_14_0_20_64_6]